MPELRVAASRVVTTAGFGISFLLGIVIAAYGPAIPYIVDRFKVPVGVGGLVVTAQFLGECAGIATIGLSRSRWTIGQRLVGTVGLFSVGLIAAAIAPTWPVLLVVVFLLGYGAGGLLVLMNLYFATRFGRRSPAMLAFVSAAYGIGTFLGPELVAVSHGYEPVLAGAGCVGAPLHAPFFEDAGLRSESSIDDEPAGSVAARCGSLIRIASACCCRNRSRRGNVGTNVPRGRRVVYGAPLRGQHPYTGGRSPSGASCVRRWPCVPPRNGC